jgi:hypothetical protein
MGKMAGGRVSKNNKKRSRSTVDGDGWKEVVDSVFVFV